MAVKDIEGIKITTSGGNSNTSISDTTNSNATSSNATSSNGTISSIEDTKVTTGRVVIKTDNGSIERPANIQSYVDLDTSDYFEERSNPYSSKGN